MQYKLDVDQVIKLIRQDSDWVFKISIGGTFNALSFVLLLSNILFAPLSIIFIAINCGYILRLCADFKPDSNFKLPNWDKWIELFMSGLTWLAIQFSFHLVLVLIVLISLLIGQLVAITEWSNNNFLLWSVPTILIVAYSYCLISFLLPFLMINFACNEEANIKFSMIKLIFKRVYIKPLDFLIVWLLILGLKWTAIIVPILSIVGVFIIPSTLFAADILAACLAVQVWKEGLANNE